LTRTVLIGRGLPGSGKSTRARKLVEGYRARGLSVVVCSSDDFFVCPGCSGYHWSKDKLHFAHTWCRNKFEAALEAGTNVVIVDNTNVTVRECRPYVMFAEVFGYAVRFLEPETPWAFDVDELAKRNVHKVPREAIERMLARWEPDMTVEKCVGTSLLGKVEPAETEDEKAAARPWDSED
jgi:tRNA uridine 5-carbamoylmethylation protein Kti12